jgi:hypothetical protein
MSAAESLNQLHRRMDCRVKPGNDEVLAIAGEDKRERSRGA